MFWKAVFQCLYDSIYLIHAMWNGLMKFHKRNVSYQIVWCVKNIFLRYLFFSGWTKFNLYWWPCALWCIKTGIKSSEYKKLNYIIFNDVGKLNKKWIQLCSVLKSSLNTVAVHTTLIRLQRKYFASYFECLGKSNFM